MLKIIVIKQNPQTSTVPPLQPPSAIHSHSFPAAGATQAGTMVRFAGERALCAL